MLLLEEKLLKSEWVCSNLLAFGRCSLPLLENIVNEDSTVAWIQRKQKRFAKSRSPIVVCNDKNYAMVVNFIPLPGRI